MKLKLIRKLVTIGWCIGLSLLCLLGFLTSGDKLSSLRLIWKVAYAIAGIGFVALAVWRARRP